MADGRSSVGRAGWRAIFNTNCKTGSKKKINKFETVHRFLIYDLQAFATSFRVALALIFQPFSSLPCPPCHFNTPLIFSRSNPVLGISSLASFYVMAEIQEREKGVVQNDGFVLSFFLLNLSFLFIYL